MASRYAFLSVAVLVTAFSFGEARNGGFSVDLIHRDSPRSPFYDPSATSSQRVVDAVRRSSVRVHRFKTASRSLNEAQSELIQYKGEYLMEYGLGTPPVKVLAIADTGSDLTWLQCKPCKSCYNQTAPIFDPSRSKTYRKVSCSSQQCHSVGDTKCSLDGSSCKYVVSYGDNSYTYGEVAVETLTLGSSSGKPVSLQKVVIGCGHKNAGTFEKKAAGIVGLGPGAVSLVSQLDSVIGGKFSYCLVPLSYEAIKSGRLSFGTHAVVSGPGTVSTPLVRKTPDDYYLLTLKALSVGNETLELVGPSATKVSEGNIIIDSGTFMSVFPQKVYDKLISAVKKAIHLEPVPDPYHVLDLCYKSESDHIGLPVITAHFAGADVKLKPTNTFIRLNEKVLCLAFVPSRVSPPVTIFGNLAQTNFLVGYDTKKKTVSFKPADCTKL